MDSIYEDMARRTGGDIYVGVVGPVRTGKSTFIKRFMETLVLPNIDDVYRRERARDELPQSGSGRTVMTAEPKFVPEEAAVIGLGGDASAAVRLIDCVGYMVPGAEGLTEDGSERMVSTPWHEEEIPVTQAAEEGTRRVITEHSTIGLVITTDGSIGEIPRENYLEAEERSIRELREIGKPFAVVLNSAEPASENAAALARDISARYGVPCVPMDCLHLSAADVNDVMRLVLFQFPLTELAVWLPAWAEALPPDCELRCSLNDRLLRLGNDLYVLQDAFSAVESILGSEFVSGAEIRNVRAGDGTASIVIDLDDALYYRTISEQSGFEIRDDGELMELLRSLRSVKSEFDHVHEALQQARETGYGVILPEADDMVLEEPRIVSRAGRSTVRLKATAPAIHLFRTDVETEVSPAVGGEKASEEIISFLLQGFDGDMNRIWESNIFGKSLYDIAEEGLTTKLHRIPPNVRNRLRVTVQKLVNDGGYGLICIIL